MNRGWARTLALTSLLPLAASVGCNSGLTVHSFAGTIGAFTFDGITATTIPAGQHLELWARTQYDDIVRVEGYYDLANGLSAPGIMIRPAISLTDPCMIGDYYFHNKSGELLTSPAAFPASTSAGGVTQTPEEQAQQVIDRINQLTVAPGATGPLLAVLPYDPNLPPALPPTATAEDRLAACDAYAPPNDKTNNPLTYVANPYQISTPLHGTVYGFVKYVSVQPPANYDGFRIDSPLNLKGVQEIFFTVEGNTVDPKNRGPLFLISQMTTGGIDVAHFDLIAADPTIHVSGTAALLVNVDEDPVQF